MSVSAVIRYRMDDLRRLGGSLASGLGVAPARASALASHLLWFDAAGATSHGIASLPAWLERIDRKEIDPLAEGKVRKEHSGTAVLDGQHGLAPLILARAAGIAAEKARDVGVGIVRVTGLGHAGPAAPVAADLAIGPFLAMITGPGPSFSLASPMAGGLPAIQDSAYRDGVWVGDTRSNPYDAWAPWTSAMATDPGWSILTLAIPALELLTVYQDRMAATFQVAKGTGTLLPGPWEECRREARERGVTLDDSAAAGLRGWADRLQVPFPSPVGG